MILLPHTAGWRYAVFGLGLSGISAARALLASGADVAAWDDGEGGRDAAYDAGIPLVELRAADWGGFAALVLAPGIPLTHPAPHWSVTMARAAGVPVIGDTALFCAARAAAPARTKLIGITGTNGKSTTTALIAHMLAHAGRTVSMGGNIGRGVLDLEPFEDGRHYVIEFSSFQLDLTPNPAADIGVLLNITPDHLDRHGTMAAYTAIKHRLTDSAGRAVFGGAAPPEFDIAGVPALRGAHNAQNANAAAAALAGILTRDEIAAGLRTFPGLSHRMEEIGRRDGVLFVNDSKATNADAAGKALASFERIRWIAGGKAKDGGLAGLEPFYANVAAAYLIGDAASAFGAALAAHLPARQCGTLAAAVAAAAADAVPGDVVLLSPAAASYDQFRNFEARGEAFRAAVFGLGGVTPAVRP